MLSNHFYHQHTRRAVTVFGTLFNDITVVKRDSTDNAVSTIRVPLSYGPTEKFLARIRERESLDDPRLAIRLPRMSFSIVSIQYDSTTQLQKTAKTFMPNSGGYAFNPTNYILSFELSIMSKHQDDALQILEQILPYFRPEYTVSVKALNNDVTYDMPIVLNSVSLEDSYEGDFESRRTIIYTLNFDVKVRYYGFVDGDYGLIKRTRTTVSDIDTTTDLPPYMVERLEISPFSAGPDDNYIIIADYDTFVYDDALLTIDGDPSAFGLGETVTGSTTGAGGTLQRLDNGKLYVYWVDDIFEKGETIVGSTSGASATITDIQGIWNALP